jgi:hypothetical protein
VIKKLVRPAISKPQFTSKVTPAGDTDASAMQIIDKTSDDQEA